MAGLKDSHLTVVHYYRSVLQSILQHTNAIVQLFMKCLKSFKKVKTNRNPRSKE